MKYIRYLGKKEIHLTKKRANCFGYEYLVLEDSNEQTSCQAKRQGILFFNNLSRIQGNVMTSSQVDLIKVYSCSYEYLVLNMYKHPVISLKDRDFFYNN